MISHTEKGWCLSETIHLAVSLLCSVGSLCPRMKPTPLSMHLWPHLLMLLLSSFIFICSGYYKKKYHWLGSLNNRSSFLTILGLIKVLADSGESSLLTCRWPPSHCAFVKWTEREEVGFLACLLIRTLILSCEPNHFPKASSPNTIMLGINIWICGGHKHSVHNTAPCLMEQSVFLELPSFLLSLYIYVIAIAHPFCPL